MNYPYQNQFKLYLQQEGKAALTVKNYDASVNQFFNFLIDSRSPQPTVREITDNDIRAYFASLQDQSSITLSTYNKILSQLNTYFSYLFIHQLIPNFPTLTIHGQAIQPQHRINTKWLTKLPVILADNHLHFYTRLTLLLCSHGFTVNEFLQSGFENVWQTIAPRNHEEQTFRQQFAKYIAPLQQLQHSSQIFLKQRYNPTQLGLSNAGLHKYLKQDEHYLGFSCAPKYLHQSFVIHTIITHPQASASELEKLLHLDPASLLYYQHLALQYR